MIGPFGRKLTEEEALEGHLGRKLWLAEHSSGEVQKRAIEECQKIVEELEKKQQKKPGKRLRRK